MADPERSTPMTVTLEDTDANSGVPTVCLEGRVAAQTGLTLCVAIPGATTTTTDRNAHTDAETRRSVQTTTLGDNPAAAEDQGGELDLLRSLRKNARCEFEAVLAYVQQMTIPLPAVYELENCLENLLREQTTLTKLDSAVVDLVDEELEDEVMHAELYTDCFIRARVLLNHYVDSRKKGVPPEIKGPDRRLKELISRLENHSANSCTRVPDVIPTNTKSALPNEPTRQEPVKGNDEKFSTVEHEEEETGPAELEVARAPGEARVEPPPCEFEVMFVSDFMKDEALPERRKTVPTHANNYPASSEIQEGLRDSACPDTAACIKPADEDIANCTKGSSRRKHRRPGASRQVSFVNTVTALKNTSKSTTRIRTPVYRRCSRGLLLKTTHRTRRKKTDAGTPFNSLHMTYRNNKTSRVALHRLWYDRHMTTEGLKTFQETWRTVGLMSTSTWRHSDILKWARRSKHRWKQKYDSTRRRLCKD